MVTSAPAQTWLDGTREGCAKIVCSPFFGLFECERLKVCGILVIITSKNFSTFAYWKNCFGTKA